MENIKIRVGFTVPANRKIGPEYVKTWIFGHEHIAWLFDNGILCKQDKVVKADTFELIIFYIIELTEKKYVYYQLKYNDANYPLISHKVYLDMLDY